MWIRRWHAPRTPRAAATVARKPKNVITTTQHENVTERKV
jgi:hypothetical protein